MMKRGREVLDVNMAHVLMLLSRADTSVAQPSGRVFECKTCNRQFSSFQALGGHRASHKKPRVLGKESDSSKLSKPRVHECSICGLEFALGQALGGHMRRHRVSTSDGSSGGGSSSSGEETKDEKKRLLVELDLNLTPMENEAELRLLEFSLGTSLVH